MTVENHLADNPLLERVIGGLHLHRRGAIRLLTGGNFWAHLGDDAFLKCLDRGVAFLLEADLLRLAQLTGISSIEFVEQRVRLLFRVHQRGHPDLFSEFQLQADQFLV